MAFVYFKYPDGADKQKNCNTVQSYRKINFKNRLNYACIVALLSSEHTRMQQQNNGVMQPVSKQRLGKHTLPRKRDALNNIVTIETGVFSMWSAKRSYLKDN
jgi:hypothetical protein